MLCPQCHQENPARANYCMGCGWCLSTTFQSTLPQMYTPTPLAEKILASRAAVEGERKQVTVLFCDVVDSSHLAARLGPEQMHRLMGWFFKVALDEVLRFEGIVSSFLGDGFMALLSVIGEWEKNPRL